jgi:RNA polymerase sigma factor (sigma-70 family)
LLPRANNQPRCGHPAAATDAAEVHRQMLAVWRAEQPRLITALARMLRDIILAEDLVQTSLVTALERWPREGIPDRPGAWLMTAARRSAIDHLRRRRMLERVHAVLARDPENDPSIPDLNTLLDDDIGDEMLRLIFTSCHPVLPPTSSAALTLRMICGLTTTEIARAFLATEAGIAQRIVRAKRTLRAARLNYESPPRKERWARLPSVLEVIYLIFNEGYTAASGDDWMRPQLCQEALRLARILVALMPEAPEAHALLALLELNASRLLARTDEKGRPVLLLDQDRRRWDQVQIHRGLEGLKRAKQLGGAREYYALQASIAACHATADRPSETNWHRIVRLYDELVALARSPVIQLNRAVAVSMADGPLAALALVERLAAEPALRNYHLLPSVRGDLLARLNRHEEARMAFETAAAMSGNARERELLRRRAETLKDNPIRRDTHHP